MRPWRWSESMRVSSVRTRTRCRYAVLNASGASFGSSLESYVPSRSMIRSIPSSVVPSPPQIPPSLPDDLFQEKFAGPIRRTDERSGCDVGETHRLARLAESVECLRRNVLLDGQMPIAWPQVLTQRQDVHVRGAKVPHRLKDLVAGLPQAEHDRGFREETVPHAFRFPKDVKALSIVRAAVPHDRLEAIDRLDVVVEDIYTRFDDTAHGLEVPLKIRDEGFDEQVGSTGFDLPYRLREVGRAAIRKVVAIDGCQDDVGQVHFGEGDGHFRRFVEVEGSMRVARFHGAKMAPAGAGVPHEHDRRRPSAPTLPDIGAMGLLAHGVQVQGAEEALQMTIVLAGWRSDPEPVRFPLREHDSHIIVDSTYEPEPSRELGQPNRNSTP